MQLSRFHFISFALCLTLFMMTGASQEAKSQVLMSLLFGDDLNSETNLFGIHLNESTNHFSNYSDTKDLRSFNLGLFFGHKFNDKYMLNLEMLAKYRRGVKGIPFTESDNPDINSLFAESTAARTINYLSVPISFRYYHTERLFLEMGPQVSMRLKAWDIFEVEESNDLMEYRRDIRDQVSKFDLGYLIGIGMMIGKDKINAIGIRHHKGFNDALKDQAGSQKHSQWAVYANLPVGRGKMKQNNQ